MASFRFELTDQENRKLEQLAKGQGLSKAAFLRLMLSKLPNAQHEEDLKDGPRSRKITIRLTEAQAEEVGNRAEGNFKSPSTWVTSLVISNLSDDPVFTTQEKEVMKAMNLELNAIGRNVNQIAHALNVDTRNAKQLEGVEWGKVVGAINEAREAVDSVRLAAIKRWRV